MTDQLVTLANCFAELSSACKDKFDEVTKAEAKLALLNREYCRIVSARERAKETLLDAALKVGGEHFNRTALVELPTKV